MISVLIVERDPAIRWQVAGAIAPDPELALFGAVGTAVEGARLALSYLPNVLLVGTTLPDAPGLAAVKALRKLLPETVLGVITADENGEEVAVILARAAARISPVRDDGTSAGPTIVRAATSTHLDELLLGAPPEAAARLRAQFLLTWSTPIARRAERTSLTVSELGVLRQLAEGKSNAEIARALDLSAKTVLDHGISLLLKLGAADLTEAVATARWRGWLGWRRRGDDPPTAGVPARLLGPKPSSGGHHAVPPINEERFA